MNSKELRQFTIENMKWVARIIKPWKQRGIVYDSRPEINDAYLKGWNDCVNEVAKETKKLITFIEDRTDQTKNDDYHHIRS